MKKIHNHADKDEMRAEYPASLIRSGVRGKHVKRYREGTNVVLLARDVMAAFPNAEAVNAALRMLMRIAENTVVRDPKPSRSRKATPER
jgi:hypothetical protein